MSLNESDVGNLIALLQRVQFKGLDEAKVAVVLETKLRELGQELKDADGDVPTTD